MFVRVKESGARKYLQVVENRREGGRTVQRVITTLGRLDRLAARGEIDGLLKSLSRFATKVRILEEHRKGRLLEAGRAVKVGPGLVFGRLWREAGIEEVLAGLLSGRRFSFPVERAVFATALHRLFASGSDRSAEAWLRDVRIEGAQEIQLHHLYRAMRWLGEAKDEVEELLYRRSRDLFSQTSLAFFDTTSLYFEGRGGETLGQCGYSKDHRPDLRQVIVGAVLAEDGRPLSSEVWPGNHADAKALLPVVGRLQRRFGLRRVCWVADRGMTSAGVTQALEERKLEYILGCRMRRVKEVGAEVLSRAGRYMDVADNLRVKEVVVEGRRYVVCHNPQQARKDAADREAVLESLEAALKKGARSLVGNKGYRRYLRFEKSSVQIDPSAAKADARYDGKFVLRTNSALPAEEVAVQYKRLLIVEQFFRAAKSLLETRPVFHKYDSTIRGHIFVSFLALVLMHELQQRLRSRGWRLEWGEVLRDLEALYEVGVSDGADRYLLRTQLMGVSGKVFQAAGVAVPPPVRVAGVE